MFQQYALAQVKLRLSSLDWLPYLERASHVSLSGSVLQPGVRLTADCSRNRGRRCWDICRLAGCGRHTCGGFKIADILSARARNRSRRGRISIQARHTAARSVS
ncbi:hypothetical protein EVAR_91113_1 [Eumeta japonica]|uniref:Uncharacterized protein n=1 Tax=Eumeta variegata TaxID=151549 RepID=A0A4C1SRU2_EUMVA|nr:hypothetical protein EVAR_91113_1 [Eumeta japonica]